MNYTAPTYLTLKCYPAVGWSTTREVYAIICLAEEVTNIVCIDRYTLQYELYEWSDFAKGWIRCATADSPDPLIASADTDLLPK